MENMISVEQSKGQRQEVPRAIPTNLMSAWPGIGCEHCMACFMDDVRLGQKVAQGSQVQWGGAEAKHAMAEGTKSA